MITKIGTKNKSGRFSIYLDDEFVCFLSEFTIFKYKLCEGKEVDIENLKQIQMESEQDTAFNLAIKYISKYQKTEKELKDYLVSKGFLEDVANAVLQKVKAYRYIDDKLFLDAYIKSSKGRYGINRIKQNLKQKGLDESLLNDIEIEEDLDDLQKIAEKYLKNKEKTRQNLQKCIKFMISRGFNYSDVLKVMERFNGEDYESWE